MRLTTEYHIYFPQANRASMANEQIVFARNQNRDLHMPAAFASEAEAISWIEGNGPAMARMGEFVILPVYRMSH